MLFKKRYLKRPLKMFYSCTTWFTFCWDRNNVDCIDMECFIHDQVPRSPKEGSTRDFDHYWPIKAQCSKNWQYSAIKECEYKGLEMTKSWQKHEANTAVWLSKIAHFHILEHCCCKACSNGRQIQFTIHRSSDSRTSENDLYSSPCSTTLDFGWHWSEWNEIN